MYTSQLAGNLSGNQFLQAVIRFTSRRWKPYFVVSDNKQNFAFVQPLLEQQVELKDPCDWHFIPAYSPW